MAWIWVLIPLAGIALGGFTEWLKFREKSTQLGDATVALQGVFDEMSAEMDTLRESNSKLTRRIEILEAIVTDEEFDELHEKRLEQKTSEGKALIDLPDETPAEVRRSPGRKKSRS